MKKTIERPPWEPGSPQPCPHDLLFAPINASADNPTGGNGLLSGRRWVVADDLRRDRWFARERQAERGLNGVSRKAWERELLQDAVHWHGQRLTLRFADVDADAGLEVRRGELG